jgi:hypothetical protein
LVNVTKEPGQGELAYRCHEEDHEEAEEEG